MHIIAIGGLPAVGKSTLLKELKKKLEKEYGKLQIYKYGLVKGECYGKKVFIFGTYDRKFGGTDTLSMAVQPIAERFLKTMKDKNVVILYEGDRLFNSKFLSHILECGYENNMYMLIAPPETLEERHIERGDTQSDSWKQGRKTKYQNIYEKLGKDIKLLSNEDLVKQKQNIEEIWQDLKNTK
jgi:dephospho-CoA kinase